MLRCSLVRKSKEFCQYPILDVCSAHEHNYEERKRSFVVQAMPGSSALYHNSCDSNDKVNHLSFVFKWENQKLVAKPSVKFACYSTCFYVDGTNREAARDLHLIIDVVHTSSVGKRKVYARRVLDVWPRAVIREGDLNKDFRWKKKRGTKKGDDKILDQVLHLIKNVENKAEFMDKLLSTDDPIVDPLAVD